MPGGHTKSAALKAIRDLYEDRSSPHRAELLAIFADAFRDLGIPEQDIPRLAEESLRNAAYPTDETVSENTGKQA